MRLKDILEGEVDEKFYISEDKVQRFLTNLNNKDALLYDACQVKREGKSREYNEFCPTLTARDYKDPRAVNENKVRQLGNIVDTGNWDNPQRGRIYSSDGCSPALNCCGGGGLEPKIVEHFPINEEADGTCRTIKAQYGKTSMANYKCKGSFGATGVGKVKIKQATKAGYIECDFRIRKLTPKECFRLMGFQDFDYEVAKNAGISNTQLYKQAGNSIVVDVLYYILKELYQAMPYLFEDLRLSSFFSGIGAFEKALDRLYMDMQIKNSDAKCYNSEKCG